MWNGLPHGDPWPGLGFLQAGSFGVQVGLKRCRDAADKLG